MKNENKKESLYSAYNKLLKEDIGPNGNPNTNPFITIDGWNEGKFAEYGLTEVFDKISRLEYEINNARRGSYYSWDNVAGEPTVEDVANELELIADMLGNVAEDIRRNYWDK